MVDQRDTRGAKSLPAKYYIDGAIFERESKAIFDRTWLCIGRLSDFSEPGQCRVLNVEGESLIAVRDLTGDLRCFYNVCRHRGTRLCEADADVGKTIRCMYHGWSYDLAGRLVSAPNIKETVGFARDDYPLNTVRIAEWNGFAFVCFDDQTPAIESVFQPIHDTVRAWNVERLVCVERRVYDVAANWKLLFQNYSECYHCSRVHPQLNELSRYTTASNDFHEGAILGGPMELADGVDSMTTTGQACGTVFAGLNDQQRRRVYYYTLFPTLFLSPHPDFVLVHRIERVAVDQTRVVCEFLFEAADTSSPGFDPSPAIEFWDTTNRQDWHVCELSQQGITSKSYRPGPYSNLECTVAAFDRHYLEAVGSG